jgi:catalase
VGVFTPAKAIDAMNARFGRHEGHRALHASGVLLEGTFTATPEARTLTSAGHMQGEPVRVTARVSNGSGDPDDPDYASDVRGLAIKIYLADGSRTDIVAQSAPRFPTRSPDGFVEFVRASEPGAAALVRLPRFLARNPAALTGLPANMAALRPPESYATVRYYAIHSFRWLGADGSSRYVRYRLVPEGGVSTISGREAKRRGRSYLRDEIAARVAADPVRFGYEAQIAAPGDPVDDPRFAWRDDRETVSVGTFELTGIDTSREKDGDVLVFDPTRVVDGIELSDDPILLYRRDAYSASVERRSGVKRAEA